MSNGMIGLKLSRRDRKRYDALNRADEALHQLWRHSELDSAEFHAINQLQVKFIHPAINAMERQASASHDEKEAK